MKNILLILTIALLSVGCKKEEKCLIGGKWYHVKTVYGNKTYSENNGTWIEFNEDGYVYTSSGGKHSYIVTDNELNNTPYQCKGDELKISPYYLNDIFLEDYMKDLNKNYRQYKR